MDDLSEGELVEEEASPSKGEPPPAAVNGKGSSRPRSCDETEEPQAKKPKLEEDTTTTTDGSGKGQANEAGFQAPTKRQLKKMMKRKKRENKKHQELESKYAAMTTTPPSSEHRLCARQRDVIEALLAISRGEQPPNHGNIQKLKTIQFQSIVSHLVTGYPPLGSGMGESPSEAGPPGSEFEWDGHRVVVVWLSMVSSDFASKLENFSKLKQLSPRVSFDIEHPGSSRFVKFGLESFMMLANDDASSSSSSRDPKDPSTAEEQHPTRCAYLFSQSDLADHGFPNPSRCTGTDEGSATDSLGRDIGSYVSVVEWPECEIKDAPVVAVSLQATAATDSGSGSGGEEEEEEVGHEEMPMFAIDCEMVETARGSELGRISIVNEQEECVYDTYVKPGSEVTNYRTKFSGLTESILQDVETTLEDVQQKLPSLLPPNSILIGHSLENDFHAMRFRHPFVIDTSCLFTPQATPTYKPGLRRLCKDLRVAEIQNSEKGHNSVEDATACMKLVKLKLRRGLSCKITFNEISPSIFTECHIHGCTTAIVDKDSLVRLYGKGSSFPAEVATDEEAVAKSAEVVPQSKFTFVQLHSMEYLLKSDDGEDANKVAEVADNLDSLVIQLVESCPPKTVLFVVCGSCDIKKVRSLQQQDIPDFNQLKREVMLARTGHVVGVVIN